MSAAARLLLAAVVLIVLAGPSQAAPDPASTSGQPLSVAAEPSALAKAQVAYRDGLDRAARGDREAARSRFEQAIEADPTFPDAHFALAGSYLPFRPDRAFSSWVEGVKSECRTFRGQHRMLVNFLLVVLTILSGAVIGAALLVAARGVPHLQHPVYEFARRRMPLLVAAGAAWVVVLQPLLWGLGVYLTLCLLLGLLWFTLNSGEKKLTVACVCLALALPLSFHGISRLAAPLNPESVPFLMSAASETPDLPGLKDALRRAAASRPEDAAPHVALGLIAEKTGDLLASESEYRQALELHGSEGRAHNNLGNVLAQTGRLDEAIAQYGLALDAEKGLAAAHYNLSQAYSRRLQFDLVDIEMKKASELDFDGIRSALVGSSDGHHPLISLGVSPSELWRVTLHSPSGVVLGLPRQLGWLYAGRMPLLPIVAILLFGLGLLVSYRLSRSLPTYSCSNCGAVVCRKCLRRIRRRAYCAHCGDTILSLKTSEFTRMLLDRRLKDEPWPRRMARVLLIVMVPGWEAVRRGRPLLGLGVVTAFVAVFTPIFFSGMPVRSVPALPAPTGNGWGWLMVTLPVLYAGSALLLKALPAPESDLMGAEMGGMDKEEPLDRAA